MKVSLMVYVEKDLLDFPILAHEYLLEPAPQRSEP